MATLVVYKVALFIASILAAGSTGLTLYYSQERMTQTSKAAVLDTQIAALNRQIDNLNSLIAQLQSLNSELGGQNSALLSQIHQLQTQVSQLQSQINELEAQVENLTEIVNLQRSQVIADHVTVDRESFTLPSEPPTALVNLPPVQYSGYLRISWNSAARMSFGIHVFDVNVTTPATTSSIYNIPVSADAIGNSWFQCHDYYFINGVFVCTATITYSIIYWY